ncbi:MAG TPA: hypothetical protein VGI13_16735 [Candidatus Acidoferrum sp.]
MKIALALTFAGICSLAIGGCNSSDTKKLTNDAKTTGEAVKQTASDAVPPSVPSTPQAMTRGRPLIPIPPRTSKKRPSAVRGG